MLIADFAHSSKARVRPRVRLRPRVRVRVRDNLSKITFTIDYTTEPNLLPSKHLIV